MLESWGSSVHEFGNLTLRTRRTSEELRQRLSTVLEELAASLREKVPPVSKPESGPSSRVTLEKAFGDIRQPAELVPEIAALRVAIITQLIAFEEHELDFRGETKIALHKGVHKFFDEIVAGAIQDSWQTKVAGFHAELASEKETSARELGNRERAENERTSAKSDARDLREIDVSRLQAMRGAAQDLRKLVASARSTLAQLGREPDIPAKATAYDTLSRNLAEMDSRFEELFDDLKRVDESAAQP